MSIDIEVSNIEIEKKHLTMQSIGEIFLKALPQHIARLKIPGRWSSETERNTPIGAQVKDIDKIQMAMIEVLNHPITQDAHKNAESTFTAFLKKDKSDSKLMYFFNGWNETHKTTSLVSAKIIMRLSSDLVYQDNDKIIQYAKVLAHMHEVTKDDFGLGHKGHDGMYKYMTRAFGITSWMNEKYCVKECDEFSNFLYETGVAKHKAAIDSLEYKESLMNAMMVSVASELWNGREYNFLAQYIEEKLLSLNQNLLINKKDFSNAKGYVLGHSGEVENRHGLHALASAQSFGKTARMNFDMDQLKEVMLDYNKRVGKSFQALNNILYT